MAEFRETGTIMGMLERPSQQVSIRSMMKHHRLGMFPHLQILMVPRHRQWLWKFDRECRPLCIRAHLSSWYMTQATTSNLRRRLARIIFMRRIVQDRQGARLSSFRKAPAWRRQWACRVCEGAGGFAKSDVAARQSRPKVRVLWPYSHRWIDIVPIENSAVTGFLFGDADDSGEPKMVVLLRRPGQ